MAKALKSFKTFKTSKQNKVIEPEVLDLEELNENMPVKMSNDVQTLGTPTLKLLDQLEKAGYTAIAGKLRELQLTDGLDKLDPMVTRLANIERHIDSILSADNVDTSELQRLLNMAVQVYRARANALLLPYGSVSPRTALSGKNTPGQVNIAVGIGTGVSPRAKPSN